MNDSDFSAVLKSIRSTFHQQKQVVHMFYPLVRTYDILQLSQGLSNTVVKQLQEADSFLRKQEETYWCIDVDLYDAIQEGRVDDYAEYVDSKLDQYIQEITSDPIYALHASLIRETYQAYQTGYYKLCTFPLFSSFEHVIALWSEGKISKERIKVVEKPQKRRLYKRIQELIHENNVQEEVIKVFVLSVLRTYLKMFVPIPDQLNQELNRNSIVHGYHDYDSITQKDVLKLFQLIRSTQMIKYISLDDFRE